MSTAASAAEASPDGSNQQQQAAAAAAAAAADRTVVVDPNPMNAIMRRAEQLRSETSDGVIYPCEYCQKVFKFKYEYERHAKIHSGDRPWQCPECMKTFSRKDNMRAHMKIHTGELVRHVCQLCGKSYGRKYDLQVHERVHTGERPFECGSCGKSFISTSRLRAHQLIHCKNIYLPRHVRNKKLHLIGGRSGRGRGRQADSDSPADSMADEDDYDEERDEDEEEDEDEDGVDGAAPQQPQPAPTISLTPNPVRHISISLVKSCSKPRRAALSSDGDDYYDDVDEGNVDSGDGDSPDAPAFVVDVAERMQQLEAALWQRKAELARRGIKVEVDGGLLAHEDFHVVLPTAATAAGFKDEPQQQC